MNFFYKKKKNLNENSLLKRGLIHSIGQRSSLSLSLKRSSPALFCHQASTHVRSLLPSSFNSRALSSAIKLQLTRDLIFSSSLLRSSFSSPAVLFFPALTCDFFQLTCNLFNSLAIFPKTPAFLSSSRTISTLKLSSSALSFVFFPTIAFSLTISFRNLISLF